MADSLVLASAPIAAELVAGSVVVVGPAAGRGRPASGLVGRGRGVGRSILDNRNHLHITRWCSDGVLLNPWLLSVQRSVYLSLLSAGYVDKKRKSLKGKNKGREQYCRGIASRFLDCGRETVMEKVCNDCGHRKPIKFSCNLVICPVCRSARMGKLASRLRPMYEQMKRPRYLTLTVPNVLDLRSGMKAIRVAFGKLRRSSCWREVAGGVSTAEATFNCDLGNWNVHLHTLYDGYTDFSRVRERWSDLTGSVWTFDEETFGRDIVAEVIGYCGKVPQFPTPELYVEYYRALRGVRLTQTYGSFFKFVAPLDLFTPECDVCGSFDVKYVFRPGGRGFGPP